MGLSRRLQHEDGFALLEVMVSAALLAVMVVAVFTTFDVTNKVSGQEKARAVAAGLAQDDQERLRALPAGTLAKTMGDKGALSAPNSPKTIDGVQYTITEQVSWLNDATQKTTCTANASAGDYMKIVSTVAPPSTVAIKPVTLTSVVSPTPGAFDATQGSLGIKVIDDLGDGQSGVTVSLNGATSSVARVTDDDGCAFFGYQPVGSYTLAVFAVGYVDPDGDSTPTPAPAESISAEALSSDSVKYDLAGSRKVVFTTQAVDPTTGQFKTTAVGSQQQVLVPSAARTVMFANTGMTGGVRKFGDGTAQSSIVGDKLFPFTSPYAVYAGDCVGERPTDAGATQGRPAVPSSALATGTGDVTVLVPAINFLVKDATGANAVSGATIRLTSRSAGCNATTFTLGGDNAKTGAGGRLADPGAPFGSFDYCIVDAAGHKATGTVTNSDPAGVTPPAVKLSAGAGGTCA